jgi:hypothetical protein
MTTVETTSVLCLDVSLSIEAAMAYFDTFRENSIYTRLKKSRQIRSQHPGKLPVIFESVGQDDQFTITRHKMIVSSSLTFDKAVRVMVLFIRDRSDRHPLTSDLVFHCSSSEKWTEIKTTDKTTVHDLFRDYSDTKDEMLYLGVSRKPRPAPSLFQNVQSAVSRTATRLFTLHEGSSECHESSDK